VWMEPTLSPSSAISSFQIRVAHTLAHHAIHRSRAATGVVPIGNQRSQAKTCVGADAPLRYLTEISAVVLPTPELNHFTGVALGLSLLARRSVRFARASINGCRGIFGH
jgi:hypothetical protein